MKKNNINLTPSPLQRRGVIFAIRQGRIIFFSLFLFIFSCGGPSFDNKPSIEDDNNSTSTATKNKTPKTNQKKKSEQCEFDMKLQTDAFLKDKPQYSPYKWNNKVKEAKILLNEKDTLTIHRGGCHYFELSINLKTLSQKNDINDSTFWFNAALNYAKDFFDKGDYELLKKNIETHEYDLSQTEDVKLYSFPHEKYDEFYLRISSEHKASEMEVGYSYSLNTEE
jgi:hypothetical protein